MLLARVLALSTLVALVHPVVLALGLLQLAALLVLALLTLALALLTLALALVLLVLLVLVLLVLLPRQVHLGRQTLRESDHSHMQDHRKN